LRGDAQADLAAAHFRQRADAAAAVDLVAFALFALANLGQFWIEE
jgi:hypothetical protein